MRTGKTLLAGALAAAATGAAAIGISVSAASSGSTTPTTARQQVAASAAVPTTTPIKHVVVLFDENVSFDHYFGTYPNAENLKHEPPFQALPNTPSVNGLNSTLLSDNPNADNPQRLSPSQALTCDQNHSYTPEQSAFDGGAMDKFVQNTTGGGCTQSTTPDSGSYGPNGIVMDYYDGNTVTGLWNLAQHFTLNDNTYGTQFGPSSPGAINVISGDTNGAVAEGGTDSAVINNTLNGDIDPYYDECSNSSAPTSGGVAGGATAALTGQNIGDLLNHDGLTWGWFQGGFTPSSYTAGGQPVCATSHDNIGGASIKDYSPHHEPFQYYQSTSNPMHLSPTNYGQVGTDYPAGVNHQYDLSWFNKALDSGQMPAVSYLKAPEYEDGHAGYSDPLDEQRFIASEVDKIEKSKAWSSTAIFITYDDSDGWYDHQEGPIVRGSDTAQDTLNGTGECQGSASVTNSTTLDRCGVGPRLPLLVISPWAKQNYVDNTFDEQASIPAFIEDNWNLGRIGDGSADTTAGTLMDAFDFNTTYGTAPAIILNPKTGEITKTIPATAPAAGAKTDIVAATQSQPAPSTVDSAPATAGTADVSTRDADVAGRTPRFHTTTVVAPRLTITEHRTGDEVRFAARAHGGSRVATEVRMRLRHHGRIVADEAATVRHGVVTFDVRGGDARRGDTVTMTVDADGAVAAHTQLVR